MKKFLVIYGMSPEAMQSYMSSTSEEQKQAEMEEWGAWMEAHKDMMVDPGNPVGKNTRISGAEATETSNDIMGYGICSAADKETVVTALMSGPHTKMPGSYTEVMEIIDMG